MSCKHKRNNWVLGVLQAVMVMSLAPIIYCSIVVALVKLSKSVSMSVYRRVETNTKVV